MSFTESPAKWIFDPLSGSLSFTRQCIRGYYSYYDNLQRFLKTYLKAFYKAKAGFIQSALSGLNLFNHGTHEGVMFIDDGRIL